MERTWLTTDRRLSVAAVLIGVIALACSRRPQDEGLPPGPVANFKACVPPRRAELFALTWEPALGGRAFSSPVELVAGPGERVFVVEQGGRVFAAPRSGAEATVALDLASRLVSGGEAGLLGFALDPSFSSNGVAYVSYTANPSPKPGVEFQSIIARLTSANGGASFDLGSLREVLSIDQPFANHNGGHLAFGPDGMLYIGVGDGGSGGDPRGYAQNKDALLGKLLRIDPRAGEPYGIPASNPFARGGGRPEIFALGLRNPWKFSFDRTAGDLWLADVGQNAHEEVNLIEAGGNYGWNIREGKHCFQRETCTHEALIDPIVEYPRSEGVSVTGGYVYRGTRVPELVGKYIYGDFGTGSIWAIDRSGKDAGTLLMRTSFKISSFGQDETGELYVADYASGKIYQLARASTRPPAEGLESSSLAATGCVEPTLPRTAPSAALAYVPNSPLWSDGADKERWVFLPNKAHIKVGEDGDFDLPPGTVTVKSFVIDGKLIETRLFARYGDGEWAGFSYEWNDAQTDATLLEDGKTKDLGGGRQWYFPSRAECFACHTRAAGFSLGLEARQLVGTKAFDTLSAMVEPPLGRDAFPPLASASTAHASTEARARGVLHANCAMCHRPGGGAGAATMDLRIDRALGETRMCELAPRAGDLGVAGAKLIRPGDPAGSVLSLRMRALSEPRMPPLATRLVDEAGVDAVEAWIRELRGCK